MTGGHYGKFAITLITAATFVVPTFAAAATLSPVVTSPSQQLLPLGANTCVSLQVQSVVPYIYGNALESFDVTIVDPSYVSVVGSVGDTGIPLAQMTRRMNPDGTLRIHVDIQSAPVNGTLPVSLTLLSAPTDKPLCVSVVSFTLSGPATPAVYTGSGSTSSVTPATPATTTEVASGTSSSETSGTSTVVSGGLGNALTRACTAAGPYQLWFILLALFMVVVGLVAFAEPPLGNKGAEVPLAAILVPLVLLLLFWYFAPACRVAGWIPVVLIIAAAIGLITAFRDQEMPLGKTIQLPQSKQPPASSPAKPLIVEKTTTTKTSELVPKTPPVKTTTTTTTTIITPPPVPPKKS